MLDLDIEPATSAGYNGLASSGSPVAELPGFIWVPYELECWHCGEPCTWIDVDFETALHPGRCSQAKWDEYAWAYARAWFADAD